MSSKRCYFDSSDCDTNVQHCSVCDTDLCGYHRKRLDLRTMEAIKKGVSGLKAMLAGGRHANL